jgi:hypothetical protein
MLSKSIKKGIVNSEVKKTKLKMVLTIELKRSTKKENKNSSKMNFLFVRKNLSNLKTE